MFIQKNLLTLDTLSQMDNFGQIISDIDTADKRHHADGHNVSSSCQIQRQDEEDDDLSMISDEKQLTTLDQGIFSLFTSN